MHYRKHKLRFDRGRMWYSIFQSIITAVLVSLFVSDMGMLYKILSGFITFVLIYCVGVVDEKLRLLEKEQDEYGKRNPYLVEMNKKLDEINESIGNNNSV